MELFVCQVVKTWPNVFCRHRVFMNISSDKIGGSEHWILDMAYKRLMRSAGCLRLIPNKLYETPVRWITAKFHSYLFNLLCYSDKLQHFYLQQLLQPVYEKSNEIWKRGYNTQMRLSLIKLILFNIFNALFLQDGSLVNKSWINKRNNSCNRHTQHKSSHSTNICNQLRWSH